MLDATDLRSELRSLGDRRTRLREADRKLAEDTRRIVKQARGKVPMIEVARLVGLDRTSLYQTYVQ